MNSESEQKSGNGINSAQKLKPLEKGECVENEVDQFCRFLLTPKKNYQN